MAFKLLLIDPDESLVKKLGRRLKKAAYEVRTASDGASALEAAIVSKPDLIITNYHLPVFDGERLRAFLRNNPSTSPIPFIFMINADREKDTTLASIGPDPTVIKPFRWEEISEKISRVLSPEGKDDGIKGVSSGVEGHLQEVSLVDLLQIFSLNRRTGIVTLTYRDQTGTVYLKEGEVINAAQREIRGEKALYRMLRWREGTFQYQPDQFTVSRGISRSTDALLMEGMRQLDEWETLQTRMPPPETVLKINKKPEELPKDLRPATQEVLLLLEFYQSVEDLVEKSTYTDYEICKSILGLVQKGIITPVEERRLAKRESASLIEAELALKIRKLLETDGISASGSAWGKVLLFSSNADLLKLFLAEVGDLEEFRLSRDNFSNQEVLNASFGNLGNLEISDKIRIQLFVLPLDDQAQPMWKPFSQGALGAILLTDQGNGEQKAFPLVRQFVQEDLKYPFVHWEMDSGGGEGPFAVDMMKELFNRLVIVSGESGDDAS